ncbi:MAG TPA: ATP-binding cassette domain-containing protein, partial [Pirellulales bacterium]|nr:ATP-binding cassette domain-containing protein [Pirellulales bacterium]
TLLRAMAGLIPNHAAGAMVGSVRLFGMQTRGASPAQLVTRAGLVLQSPDDQIVSTKVSAEVAFGLENLGLPAREIHARVEEALARAGLGGLENTACGHLSGGQKQRLVLAAVLAMRPQLLLLDEPLSQLDPCGASELLDQLCALAREGLAIVVAEHRLGETLPLAERVLVLSDGRLAADLLTQDEERLAESLPAAGLELPELARLGSALGYGPIMSVDRLTERVATATVPPIAMPDQSDARSELVPEPRCGVGVPPAGRISDRPRPGPLATPVGRVLLQVEHVEFRYRRDMPATLADLSFSLGEGEHVALVGPNGCGKSTLLAVLAGLLKPSRGAVTPGTVSLSPFDHAAAVGLVPQNPDLTLFCDTVRDELAYGPRQFRLDEQTIRRQVAAAASQLNLERLLDEPPLALSQGERLRTAVAAALTLKPRLLLLDEPTTGQDQWHVARVLEAVTSEGRRQSAVGSRQEGTVRCSLLFTTHDLRCVARFADRVLVLIAGRLAADCSPVELLDDEQLLAQARMRLPPLFEARRRFGLQGLTVEQLLEELK